MRKLSMKKLGTPASGAEKSSGSGGVSAEGAGARGPLALACAPPALGFARAPARRDLVLAPLRGARDGPGAVRGEAFPLPVFALGRSRTSGVASTSGALWAGSVAGAPVVCAPLGCVAVEVVSAPTAGSGWSAAVAASAARLGAGTASAVVTAPARSARHVDRRAALIVRSVPEQVVEEHAAGVRAFGGGRVVGRAGARAAHGPGRRGALRGTAARRGRCRAERGARVAGDRLRRRGALQHRQRARHQHA